MVTEPQRQLILRLCRLRMFRARVGLMRTPIVTARWGVRWLLERIKRAQVVDDLHHAPCCPANHYHRQRLVFHPCTCGAARAALGEGEGQ